MWWRKQKEIKTWVIGIENRLYGIERSIDEILGHVQESASTKQTCQDYLKNVDKLQNMVNEFKGCVSLARAALEERKSSNEKKSRKCAKETKKKTSE